MFNIPNPAVALLNVGVEEGKGNELARRLLAITVPADTSGGGPVWAVNGVVFKAHGRSRYPEVARTAGTAKWAVEADIVGALKAELVRVRDKLKVSHP